MTLPSEFNAIMQKQSGLSREALLRALVSYGLNRDKVDRMQWAGSSDASRVTHYRVSDTAVLCRECIRVDRDCDH